MNELLEADIKSDNNAKGTFTSAEILCQPQTWKATWKKIQHEEETLTTFLESVLSLTGLNIVLTGAGSSAFVGDVVTSVWQKETKHPARPVPTTDLVTHAEEYLLADAPLLLISFARSGNSPESTAAIQRAEEYCQNVFHLIITCNPDGKLAQMSDNENSCVFLLPDKAEDQSLAMTNSFTSMVLAATLIPKLTTASNPDLSTQVDTLARYGKHLLDNSTSMLKEVAQIDFNRIVFLGSGPLLGIARESHLKVQELTNGQVLGKFDSFLGFRHGPKAIIDNKTLLVYLLSNNPDTNRYEQDLIEQVAHHDIVQQTVGIGEADCDPSGIDHCIQLADTPKLQEAFWAILCTLPAQIIGFYKSVLLGYNPDNPSPEGTISRVVKGVKIYENPTSEAN